MTEVVIKPSEQVVQAAAAQEAKITDARGRAIVLRKPGVLAQYRLIEAIGASSSNDRYVSMVLPLIYVESIDGDRVGAISRKSEVEALIQRLGDEGIAAVMKGLSDNFNDEQQVEPDKATLKN